MECGSLAAVTGSHSRTVSGHPLWQNQRHQKVSVGAKQTSKCAWCWMFPWQWNGHAWRHSHIGPHMKFSDAGLHHHVHMGGRVLDEARWGVWLGDQNTFLQQRRGSGSDAVRQNTWAPISYFVILCLFLSFFFFSGCPHCILSHCPPPPWFVYAGNAKVQADRKAWPLCPDYWYNLYV